MSVSLAACGSSSGSSDTAVVSGTISRGGTTGSGVVGSSTTGSGTTGSGTTGSGTAGSGAVSGSTSGGTTAAGGTTTGGSTSGGTTASGGTTGPGTTGGGTTTSGSAGGSLAKAPPTVQKSISGWVSCDGATDDTAGVARAFAAARNSAFTLMVDCPVRLHFGVDIERAIFIDSGTNVTFSGAGKFTVDNVLVPAFVVANSNDIVLTNWNVEYDASLPVEQTVGGFTNNGEFVKGPKPGNAFNDIRLKSWLSDNRGIVFDHGQNPQWTGTTNACGVFFFSGDSSNVTVTGMRMYVPAAAGGDRFIPVAFSLGVNLKSNQTASAKTPLTGRFFAVPHDLTFSDISLDGTYMGWLGGGQNVVFEKIRSNRYGDLQDAHGGNVGGVGKWFAPPHLFYLSYPLDGDPGLFNRNLRFHDVVDAGLRVGTARDKGGADTISGYALSLKLGCVDCSVDNYTSNRPDGFMDVLASNGLTVSNVTATYDSAFLNGLFSGLRFPQTQYKGVTLDNVVLTDRAPSSVQMPISNVGQVSNENIVFKNVRTVINRWAGTGLPLPAIWGTGNSISLDVSILSPDSRILMSASQGLEMTLQGTPAKLKVGQTTTLKWVARGATSCSANGTWAGSVPNSGSRVVKAGSAGSYDYVFYCQNPDSSSSAVLPVVVAD
jgi:hypothetical protein